MAIKDIFKKENIVPLIGIGLTIFGIVMLVLASDWVNLVWPVIVLALIFKGFVKTDDLNKLKETFQELTESLAQVISERDRMKVLVERYSKAVSELESKNELLEKKLSFGTAATIEDAPVKDPKSGITPAGRKSLKEIKEAVKDIQSEQKTATRKKKKEN